MSNCEPIPSGLTAVANYIVYILDGAGKISRSVWISAADDQNALEMIRMLKLSTDSEVWQRDRRVGRIVAAKRSPTRSASATGRIPPDAATARISGRQ